MAASEAEPICRAESKGGASPGGALVAGLILLACVGFAGGYGLIILAPDSNKFSASRPQLVLWAVVIGAMLAAGFTGFMVTSTWLRDTLRIFRPGPSWRAYLGWILSVLFIMFLVIGLNVVVATREFPTGSAAYFRTQIRMLYGVGAICAFPGLLALLILRSFASSDEQWTEAPRCKLLLAIRLRSEIRRILFALGGFLTLIVVAAGARRRAILSVDQKLVLPPDFVVLYGLTFAIVLASLHGAASIATERRSVALLDEYAPIPSPEDADLGGPLKRRQDLATVLGVGQSWQKSFEGGVFVFAPLATALLAGAISK